MLYPGLKIIYQNWQKIKFIISGGTAALVDFIILYFLTDVLGVWYLISASLAFVAAFFVSFGLQKFWTFDDRSPQKTYRQMGMYLTLALINLSINAAAMFYLVNKLGVWYLLAQAVIFIVLAFENFLVYKYVIFRNAFRASLKENHNKILIATGIFPPDFRGPATMLEALPDGLRQMGWSVEILTYSDIKGTKQEKVHQRVWRVRRGFGWLSRLNYFWRLWEMSFRADIVYVTDIYSVGYFAYLLKKIAGKKYVVRFAGDSAWETATALGWIGDYIVDFQSKIYDSRIEKLKERRKRILVGADKVIAVSNFMAELAKLIGVGEERIKVIYNSVDFISESEIDDAVVKKIKNEYGQEAKIVLTACQLNSWKGVDGIIKILPRLKEKFKINFLILGEGRELDNLKKLAQKLGVAQNVFFLGKIERKKMMNYYKAADLFILNSNYEGLSHTLLEVMKVGVSIVATKVGGNPEVLEDGADGLLVEFNNEAQLLEAAAKILGNGDYAKSLAANAEKKLEKFNWGESLEKTSGVFDELRAF